MDKVYMTPEGYKALEEEYKNLKFVERPNVVQAISEARALGDLSENAEYHSAKDRQGIIESRIKELESKLSQAEVIDVTKMTGDTVRFGVTVTVCDLDTDEDKTFKIVGIDESDVAKGLLSVQSPLGRMLLGKKEGDEINVQTPGGKKMYEIEKVQYI